METDVASTCTLLCNMSVFTGPTQAYQYPPSGCYGPPPQQQGYPTVPQTTPAPSKASFTNSASYYHSNHQQQHQLLQHNVASSTYNAPLSCAPPSQPYASLSPSSLPPSSAQYNQQLPPYAAPGSYYGPRAYHAPPASTAGPGAPLVAYPSAPGSGGYGSLGSSQSGSRLGGTTTQVAAPCTTTAPPSRTALWRCSTATAPPPRLLTVKAAQVCRRDWLLWFSCPPSVAPRPSAPQCTGTTPGPLRAATPTAFLTAASPRMASEPPPEPPPLRSIPPRVTTKVTALFGLNRPGLVSS